MSLLAPLLKLFAFVREAQAGTTATFTKIRRDFARTRGVFGPPRANARTRAAVAARRGSAVPQAQTRSRSGPFHIHAVFCLAPPISPAPVPMLALAQRLGARRCCPIRLAPEQHSRRDERCRRRPYQACGQRRAAQQHHTRAKRGARWRSNLLSRCALTQVICRVALFFSPN